MNIDWVIDLVGKLVDLNMESDDVYWHCAKFLFEYKLAVIKSWDHTSRVSVEYFKSFLFIKPSFA